MADIYRVEGQVWRKITRRLMIAAGLMTLAATPGLTQETQEIMTCRVGFLPHWGDMVQYDAGVPTGALVGASAEVLAEAGIRSAYPAVASETRLLRDFADGKVDILVSMDTEAPDPDNAFHSAIWLEEYFAVILHTNNTETNRHRIAISPLLYDRLQAAAMLDPDYHYLKVETVQRRARLMADGKVEKVMDAESNLLALQYYAGLPDAPIIEHQVLTVPVRFRIAPASACTSRLSAINEAIDHWIFSAGMVRMRDARHYTPG